MSLGKAVVTRQSKLKSLKIGKAWQDLYQHLETQLFFNYVIFLFSLQKWISHAKKSSNAFKSLDEFLVGLNLGSVGRTLHNLSLGDEYFKLTNLIYKLPASNILATQFSCICLLDKMRTQVSSIVIYLFLILFLPTQMRNN